MLRAEVDKHGLTHLVSKDGDEAVTRLVADGNGDPLMEVHNMIVARFLDWLGMDLMLPNEDGSERCPLCFGSATCKAGPHFCGEENCADGAIEGATASMAERYKAKA